MRFRLIARAWMPVAAFFGALACGNESPVAPVACAAAVAVSVGRGMQPAIAWQPACTVTSVTVVPADSGPSLLIWQASALLGGLTPPVQVGGSPSGAIVWGDGASLTPGTAYRIYVVRGLRGDPAGGVDSLSFTSQP